MFPNPAVPLNVRNVDYSKIFGSTKDTESQGTVLGLLKGIHTKLSNYIASFTSQLTELSEAFHDFLTSLPEGELVSVSQLYGLLYEKANKDDVYTIEETDDLLDTKANVDDVYTKTWVDTAVSTLNYAIDQKAAANNVYTKTETDNLLATKANVNDVYTKTWVDNAILTLDNAIDQKAAASNVYTKAEADTLLAAKANSNDVYNKTWVDNAILTLDNAVDQKANANTVYTKSEIDTTVTGLEESISKKANASNVYTKSEVYTQAQVNSALANKANSNDVYTKTQTYSQSQIDGLLANKANSDDVYTKTETYNQSQIDLFLAGKATANTVYTKTETDTLLEQKANQSWVETAVNTLTNTITNSLANYFTKTQSDQRYYYKFEPDSGLYITQNTALYAMRRATLNLVYYNTSNAMTNYSINFPALIFDDDSLAYVSGFFYPIISDISTGSGFFIRNMTFNIVQGDRTITKTLVPFHTTGSNGGALFITKRINDTTFHSYIATVNWSGEGTLPRFAYFADNAWSQNHFDFSSTTYGFQFNFFRFTYTG